MLKAVIGRPQKKSKKIKLHHRCGLLRLAREAGDFRLGSDAIAESLVEIDVIGVGHRQFDGKGTVVGSERRVGQKSLLTAYSAIPPQHVSQRPGNYHG